MRWIITFACICTTIVMNAQQWYFWVDEWYPAERQCLNAAQDLLLVNNCVIQPIDFGHSLVMNGELLSNEAVALNNAPLHCLFAAYQEMENQFAFSTIQMLETSQNTTANFYTRHLLSPLQLHQLCTKYQVDALLILNQLVLYDIIESFPSEEGSHYAYLQACVQSHWTVYQSLANRVSSFAIADTLLWESDWHYRRTDALAQLPEREEAMLYLAREVGTKVATSLLPQWVSTQRYLYEMNDSLLQAGLEDFRRQRWLQSVEKWQHCLTAKNKKAAAMAAANIAIAYEMMGDYVSACDYAQHSIRLFGAWKTAYARQQQVNIRYYLEQLQVRQARERAR